MDKIIIDIIGVNTYLRANHMADVFNSYNLIWNTGQKITGDNLWERVKEGRNINIWTDGKITHGPLGTRQDTSIYQWSYGNNSFAYLRQLMKGEKDVKEVVVANLSEREKGILDLVKDLDKAKDTLYSIDKQRDSLLAEIAETKNKIQHLVEIGGN